MDQLTPDEIKRLVGKIENWERGSSTYLGYVNGVLGYIDGFRVMLEYRKGEGCITVS